MALEIDWYDDPESEQYKVVREAFEQLPEDTDFEFLAANITVGYFSHESELNYVQREYGRSYVEFYFGQYDIDFSELFDWDAWREYMGYGERSS